MKNVKFGEIGYYELKEGINMPVLDVILTDEDTNESEKYYLSPFRCYRFQISGTFDGVGDYGSSYVIPFDKYFDSLDKWILEEMIRGQIAVALLYFVNTSYVKDHVKVPNVMGFQSPIIDKFIEETITMWKKWNNK